MLVRKRTTHDPSVNLITFGLLEHFDALAGRITDALSLESVFYPSSLALRYRPVFKQADVVHLYNLHGGYFATTSLPALSRAKPVVLQLDDMWAFTGHCVYSFECRRFLSGCGKCPHLEEPKPLRRDTTALLWKIKNSVYSRSRLTVVAPSRWMEECARSSPLLGRFPVHRIPYGIDTSLFHPMRQSAREVLGLPMDRPIILFGAESVTQERKGARYFAEAIAWLKPEVRRKIMLLIVGLGAHKLELPPDVEARRFGILKEDRLLAATYAAADLFVLTALADNLPNVLLETVACGTPAVAFNVGGVPDAVRHGETGWLAEPRAAEAIALGIERLLSDEPLRKQLSARAREVAETEYPIALQAERLAELYKEVAVAFHSR